MLDAVFVLGVVIQAGKRHGVVDAALDARVQLRNGSRNLRPWLAWIGQSEFHCERVVGTSAGGNGPPKDVALVQFTAGKPVKRGIAQL